MSGRPGKKISTIFPRTRRTFFGRAPPNEAVVLCHGEPFGGAAEHDAQSEEDAENAADDEAERRDGDLGFGLCRGALVGIAMGAVVAPATIAPALQGWLLDSGRPEWVFYLIAIFMAVALVTVVVPKTKAQP